MMVNTEEEANKLFEKWVHILKLESWDIRFQWRVKAINMNLKDSVGCTSMVYETRQAIIQMLDPADYDNNLFEYNYEKTLVHELLHIKFSSIDDSGNPVMDKLIHQLINDLSKSFVECQKEKGNDR